MTDNLRIWSALETTDPKQTKPFKRSGGFKGTAIRPLYSTQRMTEMFGPCGQGWGISEPTYQLVPGHNSELLVFCHLTIWWAEGSGGARHVVPGVGGDKVVSYIKASDEYNRPERWENDDEAFKKAFTDAVGNAFKQLGMSADVHMGLFDDSKYVREVTRELEAARQIEAENAKEAKPNTERPTKSDSPQTTHGSASKPSGAAESGGTSGSGKKRLAGFFERPSYTISWPESTDKKPLTIEEQCASWLGHWTAVIDKLDTADEWMKLSVDNADMLQMLKRGVASLPVQEVEYGKPPKPTMYEAAVKAHKEAGKEFDPNRIPLVGG